VLRFPITIAAATHVQHPVARLDPGKIEEWTRQAAAPRPYNPAPRARLHVARLACGARALRDARREEAGKIAGGNYMRIFHAAVG
jgi:hypothetical protein